MTSPLSCPEWQQDCQEFGEEWTDYIRAKVFERDLQWFHEEELEKDENRCRCYQQERRSARMSLELADIWRRQDAARLAREEHAAHNAVQHASPFAY